MTPKQIAPWQVLDLTTGQKLVNGSQVSVTQLIRGRSAMYAINSMHFPVTILDARKVYGRVDALITPVGGTGEKWVAAEQLTLMEAP